MFCRRAVGRAPREEIDDTPVAPGRTLVVALHEAHSRGVRLRPLLHLAGTDGGRQAARGPAASSSLIFSSSRSVTIFRSWRFSICNSARMSARPRLAPLAASKAVDGAGAAG